MIPKITTCIMCGKPKKKDRRSPVPEHLCKPCWVNIEWEHRMMKESYDRFEREMKGLLTLEDVGGYHVSTYIINVRRGWTLKRDFKKLSTDEKLHEEE